MATFEINCNGSDSYYKIFLVNHMRENPGAVVPFNFDAFANLPGYQYVSGSESGNLLPGGTTAFNFNMLNGPLSGSYQIGTLTDGTPLLLNFQINEDDNYINLSGGSECFQILADTELFNSMLTYQQAVTLDGGGNQPETLSIYVQVYNPCNVPLSS